MEAEEVEGALTVHRKVNGSTTDPISGSARTKLEPPRTGVLALPKLQPLRTPGTDGILLWYSFRHNLNDDAHGGQPGRAGERLIMQKKTVSCCCRRDSPVVTESLICCGRPQHLPDNKEFLGLEISRICSSKFPDASTACGRQEVNVLISILVLQGGESFEANYYSRTA